MQCTKSMKRVLAVLITVSIAILTGCGGAGKMASMMSNVGYRVSPAVLQADGNVDLEYSVTFPPNFFYKTAKVVITPVLKYDGKENAFNGSTYVQGEGVQGNGRICSFAQGGTFSTKAKLRFEEDMRSSKLYLRAKVIAGDYEEICPDVEVADGIIAPTESYTSVKYGISDRKTVLRESETTRSPVFSLFTVFCGIRCISSC